MASEVALQEKVFPAQPGNLSSIPGALIKFEGENWLHKLSSEPTKKVL